MATALKMLRSPRELRAMVVALTVGVGLTVAAYSLIHAVLLTPLPYSRPEDLVQVWNVSEQPTSPRVLSERHQESLVLSPSPFGAMANYGGTRQSLQRAPGAAPVQLKGAIVSASLFDVLGVRASAGRTFEANDSLPSDTTPIVVSGRLVRHGIVSGHLDEVLRLDGVAHRLVGVLPETLWFPDRQTTYWVPLPKITPDMRGDAVLSFAAIARLAGGMTPAIAEARANARLAEPGDSSATNRVRVESHASLLTAPLRPSLLVLQAASSLVLLLVCLNVSWLFSARTRRLRPTFAAMQMLGATPGQVLRTHIVSAGCVAIVAAPCAVLVAWALLRFGLTLESGVFSRTAEPAMSTHVAMVAFMVTVLTCAVACLPGAFAGNPAQAARGRLWAPTRGRLVERAAMALQVSLVFAVAAQAIFFAQVLLSLSRTNVGFAKRDFVVLTLESRDSIDPRVQLARYKDLFQQLDRRGIRAAAVNIFPFNYADYRSTFERRRSREHQRPMIRIRIVTPSYFDLTGMTATSGRLLRQDDAGSSRIVVTDAFAAAALQGRQGRDLIGERVGPNLEWTITGVTSPLRQFVNEEVQPEVYVLYDDYLALRPESGQARMQRAFVLAETPRGAAATLSAVREEVADRMPDIEVRSASHIRDTINLSLGSNRLVAAGSIVFGSVALLLAALGLYAVVSHDLGRRRREIGIRVALGATPGQIGVESVLPIVMVYTVGACVGFALLLSAKSAIHGVMVPPPGVGYPPLPAVAGIAGAVLLVSLSLACYGPVKTAAGTDPATALRTE